MKTTKRVTPSPEYQAALKRWLRGPKPKEPVAPHDDGVRQTLLELGEPIFTPEEHEALKAVTDIKELRALLADRFVDVALRSTDTNR